MSAVVRFVALLLLLALAPSVGAEERSWEINGIRLESAQIERLSADMADRTVEAVIQNVEAIELRDGQREAMRGVYKRVSLDVYADVVKEVAREDLSDAEKETRVRERVLEGQRHSHDLLIDVLDAEQMERYSAWERAQVEAFQSKRWERRRRRR